MLIVLLIVLLVLALGGVPTWGYPHGYGWYPSGLAMILLVVLVILLVMGRL
jgi:Protein of unknown function (DUF3309)